MSLRNKLKASQMRLVELASYLGVSRPTLYRYLELYEEKQFQEIDKQCFELFSFIDHHRSISRPIIMDYLINKVIDVDATTEHHVESISNVRKLAESKKKLDVQKMKIIETIASTKKFDRIIDMLFEMTQCEENVLPSSFEKYKE